MKATIECPRCCHKVVVTPLLNSDLRLLCDDQAAEIERLRHALEYIRQMAVTELLEGDPPSSSLLWQIEADARALKVSRA
jgi:hypothetical protein